MAKRSRMNGGRSRRLFRRTAGYKAKNSPYSRTLRGGIRL